MCLMGLTSTQQVLLLDTLCPDIKGKIQDTIKGKKNPTHFKDIEQVQESTLAGSQNVQTRNLKQL